MPADTQRVVLDGEIATVYLSGEIDLQNEVDVLEAIRAAIDKLPVVVRIDLGEVAFLGSRGVAALAVGAREAHAQGIAFAVGSAAPIVERILDVTGVRAAFDDDDTASA